MIAPDRAIVIDAETRLILRRLRQLRTMRRWCPASQRGAFDGLIQQTVRKLRTRIDNPAPRPPSARKQKPRRPGDWRKS